MQSNDDISKYLFQKVMLIIVTNNFHFHDFNKDINLEEKNIFYFYARK